MIRALVFAVCAALVAGPAIAAKKKSEPLVVVVLPFVGKDSGGALVKDAIDLELELVAEVRVAGSKQLEGDSKKAGAEAFAPDKLGPLLAKRKVDILIRGERGIGTRPERVLVVAYGKDGKPRAFTEIAAPKDDVEVATQSIMGTLGPKLETWRTLEPVELPTGGDDNLFVDPGKKRIIDPVEPAKPSDDDDDDDDKRDGDDPDKKDERKLIDPDAPPEKRSHFMAISVGGDGFGWGYSFAESRPNGVTGNLTGLLLGGAARLDMWFFEFFGLDATFTAGVLPLAITVVDPATNAQTPAPITPNKFYSTHLHASAALKGRFVFGDPVAGLGLGGRVGYRNWTHLVPQQIDNADGLNHTIVPGHMLHALGVGLDVTYGIPLGASHLELELRTEGIPFGRYAETPDNPGQTSTPYGFYLTGIVRYDIVAGFFLEGVAHGGGLFATFTGVGDCLSSVNTSVPGAGRVPYAGATTTQLTGGVSVGLGYMF